MQFANQFYLCEHGLTMQLYTPVLVFRLCVTAVLNGYWVFNVSHLVFYYMPWKNTVELNVKINVLFSSSQWFGLECSGQFHYWVHWYYVILYSSFYVSETLDRACEMLSLDQEQAIPQVEVLQWCPWPQDQDLRCSANFELFKPLISNNIWLKPIGLDKHKTNDNVMRGSIVNILLQCSNYRELHPSQAAWPALVQEHPCPCRDRRILGI
jgi:hypothetical protein